jgi:hypothetical protein
VEKFSYQLETGNSTGTKLFVTGSGVITEITVGCGGSGAASLNFKLRRIQTRSVGFFSRGNYYNEEFLPRSFWVLPFSEPTYYDGNLLSGSVASHTTFRWSASKENGLVLPPSGDEGIGYVQTALGSRNSPDARWHLNIVWSQ